MEEKKVAFITGGSRGIGKAIALEFADNGYDIVINYVSSKTDVTALEEEFNKKGVKAILLKADVTDFQACQQMVETTIQTFGKIDVLVNNAGITKDGLLMRMKQQDFNQVVDINLNGTFNVTRNVVPHMVKQKQGRIINISSVVGVTGNAGQANYAASKAGIIGFTKAIAKELASRNIQANAVAPGFIDTDMTEVLSDSVKENINTQIPLKRMGTAEEVAKTVYFLASDASSYITGQVLHVDGGMVM